MRDQLRAEYITIFIILCLNTGRGLYFYYFEHHSFSNEVAHQDFIPSMSYISFLFIASQFSLTSPYHPYISKSLAYQLEWIHSVDLPLCDVGSPHIHVMLAAFYPSALLFYPCFPQSLREKKCNLHPSPFTSFHIPQRIKDEFE